MYFTMPPGYDLPGGARGVGNYPGDRVEAAQPAVRARARGEPAAGVPGDERGDADADGGGADGHVRRPGRGGSGSPDAGRFTGLPPGGDFTLAARVSVEFASTFDAGVLLLHAAERQWAKLCFEYSPQHRPTAVTVVTRETSDDCNSFEVDGNTLWLRITRSGAAWAFHASADGAWWRLLRYFTLGKDLVRVGFLAQSPTGEGCAATFDHITFRSRRAGRPPGRELGSGARPRPRRDGRASASGPGRPVLRSAAA